MSIEHDNYAESFGYSFIPNGGVTSARGFKASGIHAGFRQNPGRLDMALVVADEPVPTAAVFTQNLFCAAPVQVSREHLSERNSEGPSYGTARAIIINSGTANAATGDEGYRAAKTTAELGATVIGCTEEEVLVASTGVIGVQLPMGPFEEGLPIAFEELSCDGGSDAAQAILTTDTHAKECAVSFSGDDLGYSGVEFRIGAMAKGSGMIMPNMATMIAVITTDAPVKANHLHKALVNAVQISFNKVTVDSDTSTNDTCILMASGAAAERPFEPGSAAMAAFQKALDQVCVAIARAMAADGEGASRLVTVHVQGAASDEEADRAARTVANSPLVKTAIAGHDANWGRIAAALGRSGAHFDQACVSIDLMGIPMLRQGLPVAFSEEEALAAFECPEIVIDVDLGAGQSSATIWTCDFTHEYISINGDYRS